MSFILFKNVILENFFWKIKTFTWVLISEIVLCILDKQLLDFNTERYRAN